MAFSSASLQAVLEANLPPGTTGLVVGLSGGLDSACLATALAQLTTPESSPRTSQMTPSRSATGSLPLLRSPPLLRGLPVRALHVDHGLQSAAADFRAACFALCRTLGMPLDIIEVNVASDGGESIEAAARDARYRGFAGELEPGECLLTGHHAADQAETLLLQLLRGAGLKGLSAMPLCRVLGTGWHLRPLLETPKRELLRFATQAGVGAVSDPMNHDLRFDRTYLRAQLWPLIEGRWPGAAVAFCRAARHVADAQQLLDESAAVAVQKLTDGHGLSVTGLRLLPAAQQFNALRYWLDAGGVLLPSTARLTEALRQVMHADDDQLPVVVWGEHALRRYRDRVFVTPASAPCLGGPQHWTVDPGATLPLGDGLGTLRWTRQNGGLDPQRLPRRIAVCRRRGGESLKPQRRARTQSVQHLCQSLGVLPWMRDALPLLFAGESLIAIGDVWQDARWCVSGDRSGLGIRWDGAPVLV